MKKRLLFLLAVMFTITVVHAEDIQENVYEIPKTSAEITVDGLMDEDFWDEASWYELYKRDDGDGIDWPDSDLSAQYKMLWHEDHGFYVFVRVTDNVRIDRNDVIDANPDETVEAWHADLVEVNIRPTGTRPGYDPDDPDLCRYDENTFQFRFNYFNFFGGGRPGLSWGAGDNFWAGDNVYFEFIDTADGYDAEIHIPYTHFEAQEDFVLAEHIALDIVVSDVDHLILDDQDGRAVVFNNIYNHNNWNEPCWWGLGVLLDFPADDDDDDQDHYQEKSYDINQVFGDITVDGYMDEDFWASAPWEDLVKVFDEEEEEEWDDADLSGRFKMVWHEDHGFYVFIEVMDDILIDRNDVIDANPDETVEAWHADMVEVNIRPHGRRPGYDPDDPDVCRYDEHTFQFRFNYYNFFGGGRPGLDWGGGVNFWGGENVYFEFVETADGYNIEIHIPYTHFEAQDGFELAEQIALEIQIADRDHLIIEDQNGKVIVFNNSIYPGQNWNEPCWWGKGILVESDDDVSVEPINTAEKIKVFPNPASNQLSVANIQNNQSLKVVDLLGNTLFIKALDKNQGEITLDISQLKSGVYFLLICGESAAQSFKFIKH